jgi:histidinol-phosphatase
MTDSLLESDDLALALRMADIADGITLAGFVSGRPWSTKVDGSPVCDADCQVEDALFAAIAQYRPDDGALGEESSPKETAPVKLGRQWIIDPIDHTRHYLRGNPEFATLISLIVDSRVNVAVVSAPGMTQRWWAVRGHGAWKNGRRIQASRIQSLSEAHLAIAGHREWHDHWEWQNVEALLNHCAYPMGCAGGFLQHMQVAEGTIDVFLEPWGEYWDHAGSSLIIEQAGGYTTDLHGNPPLGGSLLQ